MVIYKRYDAVEQLAKILDTPIFINEQYNGSQHRDGVFNTTSQICIRSSYLFFQIIITHIFIQGHTPYCSSKRFVTKAYFVCKELPLFG